jgi:hypothetical protein
MFTMPASSEALKEQIAQLRVQLMSPSAETSIEQTSTTATQYLTRAIEAIDLQLGRGYAIEHPQLIAAFMQTCAIDSVAGPLERGISHLTETIAQAIREAV